MTMTTNPNDAGGRSLGLMPWRIAAWGLVALALLTPLVAMQFTDEVKWTGTDFTFAGVLLIGAGAAMELTVWRIRSPLWRTVIGLMIAAIVLTIWADAAVGIF